MVASYLDCSYTVLGTDGFGRSDTRAALRDFFEVDRHHIVLAALTALVEQGSLERQVCQQAIERYGLLADRDASWTC
jgi:Pyruvate dehydrogenase complex, dehydrogenase (E1) component